MTMLNSSVALAFRSSVSMASSWRGLILMERAIFFSSSSCSLVLVISLRASLPAVPAVDFLEAAPALSAFWASSISCLLASASSRRFFFSSASAALLSASSFLSFSSSSFLAWLSFFSALLLLLGLSGPLVCLLFPQLLLLFLLSLVELLLLLGPDLLPLGLLLLQLLQLLLLLLPGCPPF